MPNEVQLDDCTPACQNDAKGPALSESLKTDDGEKKNLIQGFKRANQHS